MVERAAPRGTQRGDAPPRLGVLALQGDFAAHAASFARLGFSSVEVRHTDHLDALDALVIPGGESTTLLNLMNDEPWFERLRAFHRRGGALFGTCAGAILLASKVIGQEPPGLGLLDVEIERNAWGRQVDSFEARIDAPALGTPLHAAFIRAPRFRAVGPKVEILGRFEGEPVLVRQGRILAATFHAELTEDARLHGFLVSLADGGCNADLPEWTNRAAGGSTGLRI